MSDSVLIVGAGPVGLTLALELARYRVPVRLVDRMTARETTSRAVALWPRTLELLERAGGGLSEELVRLGNRVEVANIFAGRQPIARIAFAEIATPYPFVLMLPQSETERVLVQRLEALGVRAELGVGLEHVAPDDDGVTATLRHADGRAESARFGWLIACDGAHSVIRHALGLSFEGDTLGNDWAQGDFHMTGVPFPPNEFATWWHGEGPAVLFPLGGGRYRLILGLGPSGPEVPPPPAPAAFQTLLNRRGANDIVLTDTLWTTSFRINERQVNRYRAGRVFLAGDAAHVHSPAGGQGMNTGMQDAMNLAWKLALIARGLSRARVLLDSYDPERRAVGAEVIASSGRLTRLATLQSPVARHIRNAVLPFVLGLPPVQHTLEGTLTETSTHYAQSPLNGVSWQAGAQAGARMVPLAGEPPYGAGDTPRFTLRASPSAGPPPPGLLDALIDPVLRPNPVSGGIELVRPDGYLAMAVADGEWEPVAAYLDAISPRPPADSIPASFI
ncbi:FAD-dependent oxidoreductase [Ancylobacter amanitiformis]|uniref:2-polyprenyl-6-methoxyphenol hydroxylase-like FAD-dependent oxidoreductase n=1 Tax=Ancylobacter amanitiformis TaxID=217069 RepID=A0ABU0LLM3_9HYPH|nr:FAD-dependent oxidoreductase [Ancylobacter amanitiformis]MDQ0509601.1 2-polyprenyl-6-methoxyphenol hydroxylase-like FAD-dependent oxidoreductase [Ancylobacter amanitiformis]